MCETLKGPAVFAVSGIKNSGKTTLIEQVLPILTRNGLKVATVKHDGHDFEGDVPGTDTYRHMDAGAYGTAIFSKYRFMVVKQQENITEKELFEFFPEADLILLEGFKNGSYPKITLTADVRMDKQEAAEQILDAWFFQTQISMIVLAGGKSSRMGKDKAQLPLKGETFLSHQIKKGKELGIRDIIISGFQQNDENKNDFVYGCRNVKDRHPGRGPLGGMESALREAKHPFCLVLGVDIPLIPKEELQKLLRTFRKDSKNIIVLEHAGKVEPLIGIYHCTCAEAMERQLENGRVMAFLKEQGFEVYKSNGEDEWFWNINTPELYKKIITK